MAEDAPALLTRTILRTGDPDVRTHLSRANDLLREFEWLAADGDRSRRIIRAGSSRRDHDHAIWEVLRPGIRHRLFRMEKRDQRGDPWHRKVGGPVGGEPYAVKLHDFTRTRTDISSAALAADAIKTVRNAVTALRAATTATAPRDLHRLDEILTGSILKAVPDLRRECIMRAASPWSKARARTDLRPDAWRDLCKARMPDDMPPAVVIELHANMVELRPISLTVIPEQVEAVERLRCLGTHGQGWAR